jgi:hypothetical protein
MGGFISDGSGGCEVFSGPPAAEEEESEEDTGSGETEESEEGESEEGVSEEGEFEEGESEEADCDDINCSVCNPQNICTSCAEHFILMDKMCVIPNCKTLEDGICKKCSTGYSGDYCTTCDLGFHEFNMQC